MNHIKQWIDGLRAFCWVLRHPVWARGNHAVSYQMGWNDAWDYDHHVRWVR